MNHLISFLKSKVFLINLALALILTFGMLFFVYRYLDNYTRHGETITVPDFRGLTPDKLDEFIADKQLRYEIIDSSVFDLKKKKGSILDQDPAPESKVKQNRTVYLTVNKSVPPQVKMPNLLDASFRQAEAILQTYGLKVGELIYKPDMAKNAVLGQMIRGRSIAPGTSILSGSSVDLVLGDGLGDAKVAVPDLIGMTLTEAEEALKTAMLNKGSVIANADVKDSTTAKVFKQNPSTSVNPSVSQGSSVDLFISQ